MSIEGKIERYLTEVRYEMEDYGTLLKHAEDDADDELYKAQKNVSHKIWIPVISKIFVDYENKMKETKMVAEALGNLEDFFQEIYDDLKVRGINSPVRHSFYDAFHDAKAHTIFKNLEIK